MYIREAKESGANLALPIPPNYWTAAMIPKCRGKVLFGRELSLYRRSDFITLTLTCPDRGRIVASIPDAQLSSCDRRCRNLANMYPGVVIGAELTCGNLGNLLLHLLDRGRRSLESWISSYLVL